MLTLLSGCRMSNDGTGPKKRRRPEEVRRLTLDAAAQMFAEYGYAGTSLRTIAAEAGIAESQIVRNFESKADLFTQAVVGTISTYITAYYQDWAAHAEQPYSPEETTRLFVTGLYDLFREHRKLLMALISSNAFEPELADQTDLALAPALKQIEEIQAFEIERGGYRVGPITIRTVVGMVLSMSVLENVIYSRAEVPPTREQIIEEMTALSVHGISRPYPNGEQRSS